MFSTVYRQVKSALIEVDAPITYSCDADEMSCNGN